MKMLVIVVFLLAVYGGREASCEPTTLYTATPCNKLELAYAMVRKCSDGSNITDACCSVVFSAMGRGSICYCQIKSDPVLSDHPCEPKETKCYGYQVAAIVGWTFTGVLLLLLIVVAWAGGISYGSQRKLARLGDFELMPVGHRAANFARIENDRLDFSSSCPLPQAQTGAISNSDLIPQEDRLINVQQGNSEDGGDVHAKASRADANTSTSRRPKVTKASSLDVVDGGRGKRPKKPSKWVSGSTYVN